MSTIDKVRSGVAPAALFAAALATPAGALAGAASSAPKVVLISIDGAMPSTIDRYSRAGVLPPGGGIRLLRAKGVAAQQNITATPSLTAVSHIAIATGSTAVDNNIPANTFHAVGGPSSNTISGFAAPIGGYELHPLGPSLEPSAAPLWVPLRQAGKKVVAATWPGADGATISVAGTTVQQTDPTRITDYTVPFGAFAGLGAQGYVLTGAQFVADAESQRFQREELPKMRRRSFSPVRIAALETLYCSSQATVGCSSQAAGRDLTFVLKAAAIDTTNDGVANYDRLVIFANSGIQPAPYALPSTGPAILRQLGASKKFYFEGTGNRSGTAFFASRLASDLSEVRLARYSAYAIPRNAPVLGSVDDINENVGFWAPQPDFRIPERLSPGFAGFPDTELEAMYVDQIQSFTKYQSRVAQRAIARNRDADLVMIYIEEPDGPGHQFTLTDPRQATDFTNPASIGAGQDPQKRDRYRSYLRYAYWAANNAINDVIKAVGVSADGTPRSNVFVVSDHGMAPFHTAVNLRGLLTAAGVDTSKLNITTSGPAANIYVRLQGRETDGTVTPDAFQPLVDQVASVLRNATDGNPTFNYSLRRGRLFANVLSRPASCAEGPGFCTDASIGQDFGDVFATLDLGYNFDGTQAVPVARLGDQPGSFLSVPNFYGAHGYDSTLPEMSASFYAAGPDLQPGLRLAQVRNIDVAPTILRLLDVPLPVPPAPVMDGTPITAILR